jgi:hypothetical protein
MEATPDDVFSFSLQGPLDRSCNQVAGVYEWMVKTVRIGIVKTQTYSSGDRRPFLYVYHIAKIASPVQHFPKDTGPLLLLLESCLLAHGWRIQCFLRDVSWVAWHREWLRLDRFIPFWLVVEPPLWKIWVRQLGWWHSQCIQSHKSHVPVTTNQP